MHYFRSNKFCLTGEILLKYCCNIKILYFSAHHKTIPEQNLKTSAKKLKAPDVLLIKVNYFINFINSIRKIGVWYTYVFLKKKLCSVIPKHWHTFFLWIRMFLKLPVFEWVKKRSLMKCFYLPPSNMFEEPEEVYMTPKISQRI